MDDKALITALGGVTFIAREMGEPNSTVHSWKRSNRIPRWRRQAVADLAREKGVALPTDFLSDPSPQ